MIMMMNVEYKNWTCITYNIEPGFAGGWFVKQSLWIEKLDSDLDLDLDLENWRVQKTRKDSTNFRKYNAGLPSVRRDYSSISKASAGDESASMGL